MRTLRILITGSTCIPQVVYSFQKIQKDVALCRRSRSEHSASSGISLHDRTCVCVCVAAEVQQQGEWRLKVVQFLAHASNS